MQVKGVAVTVQIDLDVQSIRRIINYVSTAAFVHSTQAQRTSGDFAAGPSPYPEVQRIYCFESGLCSAEMIRPYDMIQLNEYTYKTLLTTTSST